MKKSFKKAWEWLMAIPQDKLWHIIAGLIVGAFFAVVLPIDDPIVPVIFAGAIKEFIDGWRYGGADWMDFLATVAGGGVIQIMVYA